MKLLTLIFPILLIIAMVAPLIHIVAAPSNGLADAINNVVNNASWGNDAAVVSVGTIFGKESTSAFDSAVGNRDAAGNEAWVKMIASLDGYSSAALDSSVSNAMANIAMTGSLPITDTKDQGGVFLDYDRFVIPYLTNKGGALSEIEANLAGANGGPLLGFNDKGGWNYADAERYYDEWLQDLDILVKLGDSAGAAAMWAGVNAAAPAGNWNGNAYWYRPSWQEYEGEVGFFAMIAANYAVTVNGVNYFPDRVLSDLYTKLLASGWNSPLWGTPAIIEHAESNTQLRPAMTCGAVEALQAYYSVASSSWQSAWTNMLLGSGAGPAWQELVNSAYDTATVDTNVMQQIKAVLLFLYGIVPETGSLAVPLNEWHYEDWTSEVPSTLFRFNYASKSIRIPVHAGTIEFLFGSSPATYTFPYDGVYNVQFSSDWNTVTSASEVSGLTGYNFLAGTNPSPKPGGYGSITVTGTYNGQPVAFTCWIDSTSPVNVPASGYTFTNVAAGSHAVYGSYNGVQKVTSVTVSNGATASDTIDFSSSSPISTTRPVYWPAPLPWPLPGYLDLIVSTPLYMAVASFIVLILIIGIAAGLTRSHRGSKEHFSSRSE